MTNLRCRVLFRCPAACKGMFLKITTFVGSKLKKKIIEMSFET